MSKHLTPRAREVLGYLVAKGTTTPREAMLDLDINSGSFTRRITELRDADFNITGVEHRHPITKRRYMRYTFNAA